MASITIRGLDEAVKQGLRSRAALHGRSMEAEARELLKTSLATREISGREFINSIRAIVEPLGGIELPIYPRSQGKRRSPPDFRAEKRQR
jgi:plasmid stability protein